MNRKEEKNILIKMNSLLENIISNMNQLVELCNENSETDELFNNVAGYPEHWFSLDEEVCCLNVFKSYVEKEIQKRGE